MTNLAILCCLDANDVCTGAGCLRALRERRGGFACYEGQETELLAFLRCSHCSTDRKSTRLNSSHVSESRMPSSA